MLRWVTAQLCHQASYIPPDLVATYQSRHEANVDQLLAWLAAVLERFDAAFVIIDALDESMPYTGLLMTLKHIKTHTRFDNVRMLMTIRQYLDIEECMKPWAVSVSMANDLVAADLRIFVASMLRGNPKPCSWPASLLQEVEDALVKEAKGMSVTGCIYIL